ncbi:OmpW family protein [Salinisphaera sp. LB1]|uniref:OmpW/AlkL family protein n=1 Tax=Salinisphaera sp. LB1 TaxID=2183911 RepID=UPI000D705D4D|nr:OmpW family outer membrane protein [Salinisphaera sp. LB1]AWN15162.1 Outer membrane protein W precursor [Salinisphaera sp. LB1]
MKRNTWIGAGTGLVLALGASAANAAPVWHAGDVIVRGGASAVVPDEQTHRKSGTLASALAGTHVSVGNDVKPSVTLAYMITDHIDVELLAAWPFKHDVKLQGGALGGTDLGSIKHLPPTLSFDYHFETGTPLSPYVGVGVNYTLFFDEHVHRQAAAAGVTGLDLSNSFGPAAQVGLDYRIGDHWLVNANVRYISIDSNAHVNTAGGGHTKVNLDINPWVYTAAVGYRF